MSKENDNSTGIRGFVSAESAKSRTTERALSSMSKIFELIESRIEKGEFGANVGRYLSNSECVALRGLGFQVDHNHEDKISLIYWG